jgi:hypothetical protein
MLSDPESPFILQVSKLNSVKIDSNMDNFKSNKTSQDASPRANLVKTPVAGVLGMSLYNRSAYSSGEMKSVACDSPLTTNDILISTRIDLDLATRGSSTTVEKRMQQEV